MRIGIDASRGFVDQPTGTERYSFEVISRLQQYPEAGNHEWYLYVKALPKNTNFASNFKFRVIKMSRFWTQLGLAAYTWLDKLDVLWIPAHTLPVLRKPGVKTMVTIHGIEYEWLPAYENKLQKWYLPLSTQYAVATANEIVAVSQFTKQQLIERLGADEKKITVIWEGYIQNNKTLNSKDQNESEYLTLNPSPKLVEGHYADVLKKFGLVKGKYLIFVGTVQPRKNLVKLIEVFSYLTPTPLLRKGEGNFSSEIKLVICGKYGWMYEDILAAPKKYGVEDRVIFTNYISDVERYTLLANALVYVQPSITEGFGLPILEAWEAGLPVVSSNGGALKEVIGDAGLLFDPLNTDDMRQAIEKMTSSEKLRDEYIKKGRERLAEFSWDKAARETLTEILKLGAYDHK